MKIIFSEKQKVVLFHICLWSIWLYLPLSNAREEELYARAILLVALIALTHIPLFLLNTNWLIPKILQPKGVAMYAWSLFGAIVLFIFFHNFVRDWVNGCLGALEPQRSGSLKGIVAIVLVGAISTGYGLLNYVAAQEQINQEKLKERLRSELSFLRSQISPHFIFNVLNSIVYLIRTKSALAEPVTIKLSEIMRYMLYVSKHAHISLEKELVYLESYIELQKVRFGKDVDIRFQVEGAPADRIVEPMVMIPFVENAFKHGVGLVLNPVIDIALKMEENILSFSVKNKIAPETTADKGEYSGIGLQNVRRRLELLYPKAHQLAIKNENGWFIVDLTITLSNKTA